MGVLVLVAIGLVSAVCWHRLLPRYWPATLAATVTTVVVFQIAAYLHEGSVDALIMIAVLTSSALAFAISALVGLPIRARRRKGELGPNAL